jgi:SAM-dependent methyltransferase
VAREIIRGSGVGDRVRVVDGDYHRAAFPGDQDLVLLFGMLHQESPADIQSLLHRSHAALRPGGRVVVLDMLTDATRCRPAFSAIFGLNMALTTRNGWVFSDEDLLTWFRQAGFADAWCRPLPPPMPHWLAGATRPPAP